MKCNYFQDEKLEYEEIEIPDELLFMVRQTVAADRRKKAAGRRMRVLKAVGSVAAVLFLCLTIGVNSSYAFAEAAVKIPIVKSVANAVVIRRYRPEILAVYEENNTYYIYTLNEKEGILGSEYYIEKIKVQVKDRNDRYIAIEPGTIGADTKVIIYATKELKQGQSVRPQEE